MILRPLYTILLAVGVATTGVFAQEDENGIATAEPSSLNETSTEDGLIDAVVGYVMEPFDEIDEDWFQNPSNTTDDSSSGSFQLTVDKKKQLFGNATVRLEWEKSKSQDEADVQEVEFGWILKIFKPHNVLGATYVSLHYQVLESQGDETLVLSFFDDSQCIQEHGYQSDLCSKEENLLEYNVPSREMGPATPGTWNEVLFPTDYLDPFIDLSRLRGWKLKIQATSGGKLTVLFDQLVFSGGGDLLASPFFASYDFSSRDADPQYASYGTGDFNLNELWRHDYYKSDISSNETLATLDPSSGTLSVAYTIEQKASWGGFVEFGFFAPGNAYYNMSDASALTVGYNIPRAASIPGRAIFRLLLEDVSNCETGCDNTTLTHERYYSFHPILDAEAYDQELVIPLVGSTEPSTPFWLTGWAGKAGNSQFDKDQIKGYFFELVLDSQLGLGGLVDGKVDFFNFRAVKQASGDGDVVGNSDQCVVEENVHFSVSMPTFSRKEFLGRICCQVCQQDPECLYAMTDGRDCFVASELDPAHVRPALVDTQLLAPDRNTDQVSFWMDDPTKRGDYCTLCDCQPAYNLIDCSGRDLPILPMTFTPEVDFAPQVLDLRGNDRLSMIGSSSLPDTFKNSLQKILLPKTFKHLSRDLFEDFPFLNRIEFEKAKGDASIVSSKNFISGSDEFYSDVCCNRGKSIELDAPSNGVQYCDMVFDVPGIDSFYQEYMIYGFQNDVIMTLFEGSDFLSEAAETVEKCAEVCTITEDCRYFQYDARVPNVEHICILFRNVSAPAYRKCCERDDYADLERTKPGWVSGIPPRTRHEEQGAKLILSSQNLVADKANGYHVEYLLGLGSTPLRGAVWIEPKVHSATTVDVTIEPKRVVLYDGNQTAKVDLFVKGVAERSTLVIENIVQSCDIAFEQSSGTQVYIEVVKEDQLSLGAIAGIVVGCLLALALLVILQYLHHKRSRKKNDSLWKVAPHELHFDDPPEVLGIGTFGLVLKAEYRGTQVAVKRAVPPLKTKSMRFEYSSAHLDASTKQFDALTKDDPDNSEKEPNGYGSSSMTGRNSLSRKSGTFSGSISKNSWSQLKQDFISEIRILSKLRHPCITTVMGGVLSKDLEPLLVMELMDHKSLYDLLQNETFELDGELCINILRDISQGIRFLHGANPQIIHGDLKAANILIDRKFKAKIADFGLSKQRLGATGTPYWMAPELLREESNNSSASDIYSFGIILYEVYSRKDPYKGEDPNIVLQQIANKSICKRPPAPDGAPAEVQSLMQSCLLDDVSCRPTAEEIDNRLRRAGIEQVAPTTNKTNTRMSLYDIFPKHVAEALEEGREVEPEEREMVTIFFSDIVGFTKLSSTLTPLKVANMLDRLYHKFDNLSQKHDLFKLETIGDAYLCVTNLVKDQPNDHTKRIAEFSIDAVKAANETLVDEEDATKGFVNIRVGFHSGPIVADVVGRRNRKYTLFGDTINTSSRMESTSKTNRIQCSEASAILLREQAPEIPLVSRGARTIKGKGMMCTFWVNEERENAADVDQLLARRHTAPMDLAMLQFASQAAKEIEKEVSAEAQQKAKAGKLETAPSPEAQPPAKLGRRRSSLLSIGRKMEPTNRRVSFSANPAGTNPVEKTLISVGDLESGDFDGPVIDA